MPASYPGTCRLTVLASVPENSISILLDDAVAVASSSRQTIVIEDENMAAQYPDETGRLKRAGRH